MSNNLTYKGDAVYSEKYTDKTTGEEKTKYTNVGAWFERDDGSIVVKHLNSWINLYPARQKDFSEAKEAVQSAPQPHDDMENEIPF